MVTLTLQRLLDNDGNLNANPVMPNAPEKYLYIKDRLSDFGEEVNKRWPAKTQTQKVPPLTGKMLNGFQVCLFLHIPLQRLCPLQTDNYAG